jgi:Putative peptidoglycan binding domain/D-alanyl-D-alanine carboxypeptidase
MKILPGVYREEHNWRKYVTFASEEDGEISLVFLWRLAAFCRDYHVKSVSTIGYRSTERQKRLYDLYVAGKGNVAARPGTSWHEFHLAVDLREAAEGGWFKRFSEDFIMPYISTNQGINKYGLIAPLNRYEKPKAQVEWWHWQPIETYAYTGDRSKFLQPDDAIAGHPKTISIGSTGPWVSELLFLLTHSSSGKFDEYLVAKVKEFQTKKGLVADGIVGPKTWVALYRG